MGSTTDEWVHVSIKIRVGTATRLKTYLQKHDSTYDEELRRFVLQSMRKAEKEKLENNVVRAKEQQVQSARREDGK